MIVFLTILSLVSGLVYGYFDVESSFISAITQNTHIVLYILMFSVGISIGMYDGIVQKIREYHIKIFIIPIGIIIGSLLGGIICSMIVKMYRQKRNNKKRKDLSHQITQKSDTSGFCAYQLADRCS